MKRYHLDFQQTIDFLEGLFDENGPTIGFDYALSCIQYGTCSILPNKHFTFDDPAFAYDIARDMRGEYPLYITKSTGITEMSYDQFLAKIGLQPAA